MMNRILTGSFAMLAMLFGSFAHAADFPSKTITMIVPFSAGGPTDTVARLLGQAMGVDLKQTVIVENVAGAGGNSSGCGCGARRPFGSRRLHALSASHRPVHGARALSQIAIQRRR